MSAIRRSLALAALLAAAALPSRMSAQATPAGRDSAIARLQTGQQIRLAAAGLGRLIGRAGVASGDTLDFAQADAVRRIPVQAIDSIWTRGRATKTGLIIGGAVGAVFGGLAGAVGAGVCEYDCASTGTAVVTAGLVGAVGGAGIGALVGALIPKWKRAFP